MQSHRPREERQQALPITLRVGSLLQMRWEGLLCALGV